MYHPDLPLSKACPCLNPIHENTLSDTRVNFCSRRTDSEGNRACHYIFYLSERCRQSVCFSDLAPCSKNKGRPFDGNAPARCCSAQVCRLAGPMGRSGGRGPFANHGHGPIFLPSLPGFTATLSLKRSENNIESRKTIGFKSIVHKERISPLLPFATTPHRASLRTPPNPPSPS